MKTFKTWGDFAKNYDLVLFNHVDNFPEVMEEWFENHLNNCEHEQARIKIEELANSEEKADIKERQKLIDEFGEDPNCNCEVFQWYAIAISDDEAEWLNKQYNLDIFYSDFLDLHILPVYHFGTAWDYVNI